MAQLPAWRGTVRITFLPILLVAMSLGGWASTTLDRETFKSYHLHQQRTVNIGDVFLADQDGTVETRKEWVGILNAPDGWRVNKVYSKDWIRKELIYSGRNGNTVEVSYREFRGGYAAPAFYQNLKYDLDQSKVIRFQKFTVEVLAATNESITYKVTGDR